MTRHVLDNEELTALLESMLDPNMPACPDWCTLPAGHPWDSLHPATPGLESRGHQGPQFGPFVSVGSIEFNDRPGVHGYDLAVSEDVSLADVSCAEAARELAAELISAAEWIEAQA